jgi:hypothetical protein
MSILAHFVHWRGAVRDAWRALLHRKPAPTLTADLLYVSVESIERGDNQHGPIELTTQGDTVPEAKCQPPESTPGSYNWVRTHAFFATETGLMCPDCGLAWPEEVRS